MIESITDKALWRYWTKGDAAGIKPEWRRKVQLILNALHAAKQPSDLAVPGMGFHALSGDMAGRFAVTVSRNWRITFAWTGEAATHIRMEDYHHA